MPSTKFTLNELTNGKKEILGTMTKKECRIFFKFTLLGQLEFKIMTPITYAGNLKRISYRIYKSQREV